MCSSTHSGSESEEKGLLYGGLWRYLNARSNCRVSIVRKLKYTYAYSNFIKLQYLIRNSTDCWLHFLASSDSCFSQPRAKVSVAVLESILHTCDQLGQRYGGCRRSGVGEKLEVLDWKNSFWIDDIYYIILGYVKIYQVYMLFNLIQEYLTQEH